MGILPFKALTVSALTFFWGVWANWNSKLISNELIPSNIYIYIYLFLFSNHFLVEKLWSPFFLHFSGWNNDLDFRGVNDEMFFRNNKDGTCEMP